MEQLDQLLAWHSAPTLLGFKPSSLIRLSGEGLPRLIEAAGAYGCRLEGSGIRMDILCRCSHSALLLVYSPALLGPLLRRPTQRRMLKQAGYPVDCGLGAMLRHMQHRIATSPSFPHEVGLFLGYPPGDVAAFQRQGGKGCKLCGYWKVYSGVPKARRLFRLYDRCRDYLCRGVAEGASIPELVLSAS